MIVVQPQTFRLPVHQAGTNTSVNLPKDFRALFGIEKGDTLVFRYDPASDPPMIVVDIEKPPPESGV